MVRLVLLVAAMTATASAGPCAWDSKKFEPDSGDLVVGHTKAWLEKNFGAGRLVCKLEDHWVYHSVGCSDWDHLLRIWFRGGKAVRVEAAQVWTGKICDGDLGPRRGD